ncbi:uncharacterized protein LOC124437968 [Xenia sp. Carnegie-2017]|uniref:uncharacterized protein LOC124437968 n=1 Tax=Xenia sp. Carnegie-2017 TaxID=2897299 RepID=UPI001F0347B5|nr:uncharacterized protein LOC124437968 [Xenia sp. Carnegie-2017]
MLSDETSTHWSIQRGAKYWIAPESYDASDDTINKVRYKKESDIMNAGMVAYYVATKGRHPFGDERLRLDNILKGNPVGLNEIMDATLKDILSWMLQLKPEDRPLANEALKHPYLQTDEENFDLLCDVGNEPEIKISSSHSLTSDVREQLNLSVDWMDRIDPEVFNHFNKVSYDSTWLGCLRFLRNVRQHWHDKPRPQLSSCVKDGNYQEYFLRLFMELPLLVHRTIRPALKKHFANSAHPVKREEGKGKKSKAVIDYVDLNASEEKKSLLYPPNDNDSDADIAIKSTSGPNEAPRPNTTEFKNTFLTKGCKIKDCVHEKLKRFSWLCGKYGIAYPNKEMRYLHLYLEVDNKMKKIDLKPEINKVFDGNASEYIELRFVNPSDDIIIRPLSNIMVLSKRNNEHNEKSRGTLTLFSCKDGKHYALTCLHVGYGKVPKEQMNNQFFYIRDKIENDKLAFKKFLLKNKYSYTHQNSITIPLGELFHYSFDLQTDIMAILIDDKEDNFTAAEIEMPSSFDAVFDNLLLKENEKFIKLATSLA